MSLSPMFVWTSTDVMHAGSTLVFAQLSHLNAIMRMRRLYGTCENSPSMRRCIFEPMGNQSANFQIHHVIWGLASAWLEGEDENSRRTQVYTGRPHSSLKNWEEITEDGSLEPWHQELFARNGVSNTIGIFQEIEEGTSDARLAILTPSLESISRQKCIGVNWNSWAFEHLCVIVIVWCPNFLP
jgi:hypothetical protein